MFIMDRTEGDQKLNLRGGDSLCNPRNLRLVLFEQALSSSLSIYVECLPFSMMLGFTVQRQYVDRFAALQCCG